MRRLRTVLAAFTMLLLSQAAINAGLIVASGSTYTATLWERGGAWRLYPVTTTFDGLFTRYNLFDNTGAVLVSEFEQDLGNGLYRIGITFGGTTDLFPGTPGGAGPSVSIGLGLDPLDFIRPVDLVDSKIILAQVSGVIVHESSGWLTAKNWDGHFPANAGVGAGPLGYLGEGVRFLRVEFLVQEVVPEPASMALFGLGAAGLGVIVRRRKRRALLPS